MLLFLLIILITNITNLMTYPIKNYKNEWYCNNSFDTITNLIAFLMRFIIPFVVMVTLNLMVIWRLKRPKIRTSQTNPIQIALNRQINRSSQTAKKKLRFILSTLFIDYVFLIFHFPLGVNYGVSIRIYLNGTIRYFSPDYLAIFFLFSDVTQLIALFHSSVLIILFISFNKYFRAEFIILFRLDKILQSIQI